jgi:hypothetical protein
MPKNACSQLQKMSELSSPPITLAVLAQRDNLPPPTGEQSQTRQGAQRLLGVKNGNMQKGRVVYFQADS